MSSASRLPFTMIRREPPAASAKAPRSAKIVIGCCGSRSSLINNPLTSPRSLRLPI